MASIVYEGVGGAGSLFKDMKFFILQKVPMRSKWIELIQVGKECLAMEGRQEF